MIDLINRTIDVLVDDEVLAERRRHLKSFNAKNSKWSATSLYTFRFFGQLWWFDDDR